MLRWQTRVERSSKPLAISLWSGAGGLDLGLTRAGYDIAVAADCDEWACRSHAYNSDALVCCRDLSDPEQTKAWLRSLRLPAVALVAGGFPCQPYSRAGHSIIRHLVASDRRAEIDERIFAWKSFVAAIDELRPQRALAENVPDLVRFDGGRQLRDIVKAIEAIGYDVDVRILPARLYGVPQYRERLFIQAVAAGGTISWPKPVAGVNDTLQAAIGDLPMIEAGHQQETAIYEPRCPAPAWAREGVSDANADLLFDHIVRDVREDDLEAFEQLQPGGTYLDVPVGLRRYDDENFTDKYKRLAWDRPCRTITAHIARDGYWYIHPDQHRTLSVREAARVQTFPDWFRFAGFPSNRLTQIGNAVPPLLGHALGVSMLGPEKKSAIRSTLPDAAKRLRTAADAHWKQCDPWSLLVREVIFSGRAGDERLRSFLDTCPTPADAAKLRRPFPPHIDRARNLARALGRLGGALPEDASEIAKLSGTTAAVADLVFALLFGGRPPRSGATVRVAERVSGVRRAGSLNGVSHVVLARLADFGDDVSANQLLVDIARSVCLPESPLCDECPLEGACAYAVDHSAGYERDALRTAPDRAAASIRGASRAATASAS